ncbi:MAG: ribosome biogenesis/translation initiation ATPase RLI [Candidatus Micrarchaeota archaeon]
MPVRIAVIDRELCIKERCGYVCSKVCPPNRMGEECIVVDDETKFPVISEILCIGCGICVKKCPMKCIAIINLARELENPIYQYGVNAFRLYGLPLPKESGAVSLIGKNGIGKTTAIKLLSRQMDPNFAVFTGLSKEEISERLSMEARRYFERAGTELKVSSKPQYINRIRDVFSGTVDELLKETSGREDISALVGMFGLEKVMKRKISQLSGGELQKVAIAAAYVKDADIYYFDEVTNYLDIEERLRVAVILKELAERRSVLIAEHDLTILDYVSTYVSVFYGEENVYGVVSGVKNVRVGINEYLRGFLKDENMRFREYEIGFSGYSEGEVRAPNALEYGSFEKKFEGFIFRSEPGAIRKGEILGLVGKNALGKSLLVKMMAGEEKPDSGNALDLRISYKPQYISSDERTVLEVLNEKAVRGTILEECKRRLKLNILMEKKLSELSGGELQRVAIAKALSTEADIYLFDEPSAFLDIEQRFEFADLLRKVISESGKSAFVVDHDVVFMDAIANRLIIFEGKSSVEGHATMPLNKKKGMNSFLKVAGITMRRDKDTKRPRINKPGSNLDSQQKESGNYYYTN